MDLPSCYFEITVQPHSLLTAIAGISPFSRFPISPSFVGKYRKRLHHTHLTFIPEPFFQFDTYKLQRRLSLLWPRTSSWKILAGNGVGNQLTQETHHHRNFLLHIKWYWIWLWYLRKNTPMQTKTEARKELQKWKGVSAWIEYANTD